MKVENKIDAAQELAKRKAISRRYIRSLSLTEKIEKLVNLQNQTYQMLSIREQNGGLPIPIKWQKWYEARFGESQNRERE